jgi:predicted Zn-ribbon and HTH transcriptional regulator
MPCVAGRSAASSAIRVCNKNMNCLIMKCVLDKAADLRLTLREIETAVRKETPMARARRSEKILQLSKQSGEGSGQVFWTRCAKCGDTWVTKAVLSSGKCPVCGGKPRIQKAVF